MHACSTISKLTHHRKVNFKWFCVSGDIFKQPHQPYQVCIWHAVNVWSWRTFWMQKYKLELIRITHHMSGISLHDWCNPQLIVFSESIIYSAIVACTKNASNQRLKCELGAYTSTSCKPICTNVSKKLPTFKTGKSYALQCPIFVNWHFINNISL